MSDVSNSGNGHDKKTWVIARMGDAFKVYSPTDPADIQTVRTTGIPSCTCADFNREGKLCIHIEVVLAARGGRLAPAPIVIPPATPDTRGSGPERGTSPSAEESGSQMLLKRSVSPDGRIDSLSVEFSLPVGKLTTNDIKTSASKALALQSEIVQGFLGKRERPAPVAALLQEPQIPDGSLEARIKGIHAMDTKWGRRLYLAFFVNGEHLRLFGSPKKLSEILGFAGYREYAEDISEGLELDLPCRVVVEPSPDGRFMNVRRVFPPKARP